MTNIFCYRIASLCGLVLLQFMIFLKCELKGTFFSCVLPCFCFFFIFFCIHTSRFCFQMKGIFSSSHLPKIKSGSSDYHSPSGRSLQSVEDSGHIVGSKKVVRDQIRQWGKKKKNKKEKKNHQADLRDCKAASSFCVRQTHIFSPLLSRSSDSYLKNKENRSSPQA